MSEKIKILFFNKDVAGVGYWRTLTPAMQLDQSHSDKFQVEINPNINYDDFEGTLSYLKQFQIIHYHRFIFPSIHQTIQVARELRKNGTVLIMDIDDYWMLDKSHPMYATAVERKMHLDILDNLKIADYVTTTTDLFATEIRKITGKDNVMVFPNSVNPEWMKQFQSNKKVDENFTRITYMAGSSHKFDMQQLVGVTSILNSNESTKNKFKYLLAGWDTEGSTTEYKFNQEFATALQKARLWDQKMIKQINKCKGNVDLIEGLPSGLKEKFRNNVFSISQRSIRSEESVYLDYEKILTDNYKIINNADYLSWLDKYERDRYEDAANVPYERRWTQKANIYAQVLDETDISLAPLADHTFNRMKSNLKQVEVWTRKIPIICTDIPPYNVDGKHMKNCILIPYRKNSLPNKKIDQDWAKAIKLLITEPNLREDLGNQLHEDFKVKYNLKNVTEARAEFYSTICAVRHTV
jgi:glycosyltransferase involved in cell wall biosynthesis